MIFDGGPALLSAMRFGALASPGSQFQIPSGAPWAGGDLAVFCQLAVNTAAAIPANVIPGGWTECQGASLNTLDGSGNGMRQNAAYKILANADLGSTVTAMNGAGKNRVAAGIFHFNRPVKTVSIVDRGSDLSTGALGLKDMIWDGLLTGSHFYLGFAHGETSLTDSNFNWGTGPIGSPYSAEDGLGTPSVTRTFWSFFAGGGAPTSHVTMQLGVDKGDFNGESCFLLRLN